jgi:uncharacterized membrane protein YkgB
VFKTFWKWFNVVDPLVTDWMARHGILFLRISVGVVFLWFGVLKFFPGFSPAEELAGKTIERLTLGFLSPSASLPILAVWESLIGLGLLMGRAQRIVLFLLFLQMPGTILPLFLFPQETWISFPFVPTLEGQYIIKNLVLISAGITIGATVRGGRLTSKSPN